MRKELTKTFMMIWNGEIFLFSMFVHKYFNDLKVNPCSAGILYIPFLASLKPNKIPLKIISLFVIYNQRNAKRCTDHQILQVDTRPFFKNEHIFRPLKLEISISALNHWEIETNNSVAQGLLSTYACDVLGHFVCKEFLSTHTDKSVHFVFWAFWSPFDDCSDISEDSMDSMPWREHWCNVLCSSKALSVW